MACPGGVPPPFLPGACLTGKASNRWREAAALFGCWKGLIRCPDGDQRGSIWNAHEPTHAALDGQTLSGNRPRRQSGYVRLRRKHTREDSEQTILSV